MIGTIWRSNIDYICFDKGDLLIATRYFECESIGKMFVTFTTSHGETCTWREEWMGEVDRWATSSKR